MPVVHRYDRPDRFVAGTVGPPGHRTFFLQARADKRLTSVALEKQQVAVLAERIDELLDEVMRGEQGGLEASADSSVVVPAIAPVTLEDTAPLDQPIEEDFRAGTMTLAWDGDAKQLVIEVFALDDTDEESADSGIPGEDVDPSEVLIVTLTAGAARAFCKRATAVVSAGRPPCQFCGIPLDPEGHLCPRANGFRRR